MSFWWFCMSLCNPNVLITWFLVTWSPPSLSTTYWQVITALHPRGHLRFPFNDLARTELMPLDMFASIAFRFIEPSPWHFDELTTARPVTCNNWRMTCLRSILSITILAILYVRRIVSKLITVESYPSNKKCSIDLVYRPRHLPSCKGCNTRVGLQPGPPPSCYLHRR